MSWSELLELGRAESDATLDQRLAKLAANQVQISAYEKKIIVSEGIWVYY